jgi:hypothetical protein
VKPKNVASPSFTKKTILANVFQNSFSIARKVAASPTVSRETKAIPIGI